MVIIEDDISGVVFQRSSEVILFVTDSSNKKNAVGDRIIPLLNGL